MRLSPDIPPDLERIITRALEKDRNLRYQSASDMKAEVSRLKRDMESSQNSVIAAADDETHSSRGRAARMTSSAKNRVALFNEPTDRASQLSRSRLVSWKMMVLSCLISASILGGGVYWRSHRVPKLTDQDTVVLADFNNTTGDPVFDDTLKQAISVQLGQSPFLNILSDARLAPP